MPIDPLTYHIIQLQARQAKLVAEQDNLNSVIAALDESICLITLLSNGDQRPPPTPQPPNIVTESLHVFCQYFRPDPLPNERVEFRLG
jgi:hypothetical protein